jgi:hypothetical protein
MTDHPITPPPELVQQWVAEIWHEGTPVRVSLSDEHIATRAAQWGADQELEACCDHLRDHQWGFVQRPDGAKIHRAVDLEQARRPKPPSLKEQALAELEEIMTELHDETGSAFTASNIRRALEALPDD